MAMTITATGAAPAGTVGPAWPDTSGKTEVVRNPLRVQDHVRRKVGDYMPGLTAVTAHARYYSRQPWIAAHAADAPEGLAIREMTPSDAGGIPPGSTKAQQMPGFLNRFIGC